jgi:single-strand DNA-binding protein
MGNYIKNVAEVKLIGRITRDLEQKFTPSGTARVSMSVAINKSRKGKNGEWETETDYFNVIAWGKEGEDMCSRIKKGMLVQVDGRLKNRSWEKDGAKRTITEIIANTVVNIGQAPEVKESDVCGKDSVPPIDESDIPF